LLIVEDVLAEYTVHWQFYVGWFLLAVVLLAPKGLAGLLSRKSASKEGHA
jgi:branched-chain amino acid transport system permease protein